MQDCDLTRNYDYFGVFALNDNTIVASPTDRSTKSYNCNSNEAIQKECNNNYLNNMPNNDILIDTGTKERLVCIKKNTLYSLVTGLTYESSSTSDQPMLGCGQGNQYCQEGASGGGICCKICPGGTDYPEGLNCTY